jgi:hypothetical protein
MTSKITPPRRIPAKKPASTKAAPPPSSEKKPPRKPLRWNLNTFLAIGMGLVIFAAVTFPVWRPLVTYDVIRDKFALLPVDQQALIRQQPENVQQAMVNLVDQDQQMGLNVIQSYLRPVVQISEDIPSGGFPAEIARGAFAGQGLLRSSGGNAIIYAITGINFLRFENFDNTWGPDLRVYFSAEADPFTTGLGGNVYEVSALRANRGNFNHRLPDGFNVYPYKSVVIWDAAYQVVYGVAPLTFK